MNKFTFIIFLLIGTNAFGQVLPKTAKSPTTTKGGQVLPFALRWLLMMRLTRE